MYVNYPKFSYKSAFRFVFSVLNIYNIDDSFIDTITFTPIAVFSDVSLLFFRNLRENAIVFSDYCNINLKNLTKEHKRILYKRIIQHFFGYKVDIDYDSIKIDVPFKPLELP